MICCFVVIAIILIILLGLGIAYRKSFARVDIKPYKFTWSFEEQGRIKNIKISSQGVKLQGYILGEKSEKGLVIMSHGIGSYSEEYYGLALYLVDTGGYQVLMYDNYGCGNSGGKSMIGLPNSIISLNDVIKYATANLNNKLFLYGHSWGGYAVTSGFNIIDNPIKAVASLSAPNSSNKITIQFLKMLNKRLTFLAPSLVFYTFIRFGRLSLYTGVKGINKTYTPFLLIHGENDETINFNNQGILCHESEITNKSVEYWMLTGKHSGHTNYLRSKDGADYVDKMNAEFAKIKNKQERINYIVEICNTTYDKELASQINEVMMERIVKFYDKYQ